ncbi:RTA1 like protein-domain-containing protein [Clohesyomyces aquaticus]|uniref:RTA1 like protein-domain-containing protein n=1 Tax=Clohesyomyces aquaticus TaxID=1231657 RepID=A0A1Y1YCI0_9PLEO|nr:RTA1 like protein-domain-containing protein [Clohesyomyces aquaticus]
MTTVSPNGIYHYKPNQAGPIIAFLLFGPSAIYHLVVMIRSKTWFYIPFTVGAFMMTLGYIFRLLSAKDPNNIIFYIHQNMFIILPPSLYAATMYMIYGRIVLFVNAPDSSIIPPHLVTKIFVCGDVLAFLLQSSGGGMMAISSMGNTGRYVLLIGLAVQLISFGFFLYIAIIFDRRTRFTRNRTPIYEKHHWRSLLLLLMVAAVIIILRSLFRAVEFGQGEDGFLMTHEIFMYLADTAPMFAVQVMFHWIHAGGVLPPSVASKILLESDSTINLQEGI